MADAQVGNVLGVAQRGTTNLNGGADARTGANLGANGVSIAAMRARLTAINATQYTSAYLDRLSYNDMLYALRLAETPTGI